MRRDGPGDVGQVGTDNVPRRFVLTAKRVRGIIILAILPILAISGLTAMRREAAAVSGNLALSVDYPRVLRYLRPVGMNLNVSNIGDGTISGATLTLDSDYFRAYTGLTIMPAESAIDADGILIELADIAPGGTQAVRIELRAAEYWYHSGPVTATAGEETVTVDLGTLVLP